MDTLVSLVIALGALLIIWYVAQRFSPDPLITKIVQVVVFILAILVLIKLVLPLVGVSF
jgi:Co/Zn/Cd efflux system component